MKSKLALVLAVALATSNFVAIPVAGAYVAKKMTCKAFAEKAADSKGRQRIFKTGLMGGTTALLIGAILSNNNTKGEVRAGGAFGGGLISGTAYKVQWKRDYNAALSQCRRGA